MTRMSHLLRGRWFYVGLGLVVLLIYGPQLMSVRHHDVPRASVASMEASLRTGPPPAPMDPEALQRAAMRDPAVKTAVRVFTVFGLAVLIGCCSAVWRGVRTGQIRSLWRFSGELPSRWSLGEMGRVLLLAATMLMLLPYVRLAGLIPGPTWVLDQHLWMAAGMVLVDGFVVLAILAFASAKHRSALGAFGITPAQFRPALSAGIRAYVVALPVIVVVFCLVQTVFKLWDVKMPAEPIQELLFDEPRTSVFLLTAFLACIVGPIAEELFFRGVLYPAIRGRTSPAVGIVASAAVFSLFHTSLLGFIPILGLGCLLAYLYERTGSLLSPLLVHILHNTLLMSLAAIVRQAVLNA